MIMNLLKSITAPLYLSLRAISWLATCVTRVHVICKSFLQLHLRSTSITTVKNEHSIVHMIRPLLFLSIIQADLRRMTLVSLWIHFQTSRREATGNIELCMAARE